MREGGTDLACGRGLRFETRGGANMGGRMEGEVGGRLRKGGGLETRRRRN